MKDLLNLKMEIKGEYGDLKLVCEDTKTGNVVTFKQYTKRVGIIGGFTRWEPSEIIYDTMSYYVKDYTKVYRLGTNELVEGGELEAIRQFIDDVEFTHSQFGFIGMLGLTEPKR